RREECGQSFASLALGTLESEHDRERLLSLGEVVHLDLPRPFRRAPDAQEVVVGLESLAERVTEAREGLAHRGVFGGEERRALRGRREQRSRLLRSHRAVPFCCHVGPRLERDVQELTFADPYARLVDELRE